MPATWVVAGYRGVTRELLLDFKERGVVALGRPLGEGLARAAAAAAVEHPGPLVVVPVPSAASSVRRRGDDVVWLLARRVAGRLRSQGRNVTGVRALRQLHPVADSAGLSAVARAQNLRGALGIRAAAVRVVAGAAVILVDDLVTTGATLAEAAAVLDAAGARVLGAAAVAATARATSW
jgi:predicted amidophosphoribosyltransferase